MGPFDWPSIHVDSSQAGPPTLRWPSACHVWSRRSSSAVTSCLHGCRLFILLQSLLLFCPSELRVSRSRDPVWLLRGAPDSFRQTHTTLCRYGQLCCPGNQGLRSHPGRWAAGFHTEAELGTASESPAGPFFSQHFPLSYFTGRWKPLEAVRDANRLDWRPTGFCGVGV